MRIVDVKTAFLENCQMGLLIRVDTDEGVSGFGEAFAPYNDWKEAVKPSVLAMKPILVGEDPLEVQRLCWKMRPGTSDYKRTAAISGVEGALWDLAGRALGVPVYKLLGGKLRDRVKIYCDCHSGRSIALHEDYQLDDVHYTPEAYAANARRIKTLGFDFLKFDLSAHQARLAGLGGMANAYVTNIGLKYLVSVVEALREAVGDETELALDCGQGNVVNALRFADAVEKYRLAWLEDMLDMEGLATVTPLIKTPTLTGEGYQTFRGFWPLFEKKAIRIVAPDLAYCGGLLEGKKVVEMAAMHSMLTAVHNICTPLGTMAAVHACSTMPNLIALEFHMVAVPWWQDLVKGEKPVIKNGYIAVPEKPGTGVELDEEQVRKHLKEGETYFE